MEIVVALFELDNDLGSEVFKVIAEDRGSVGTLKMIN